MFISQHLKQKQAAKELRDQITNNIHSTSELVKAILPEDHINEHETQINEALQCFESQNQRQDTENKNLITFKYPGKTLEQAELDYCRNVKDAELKFGREYAAWNEKMYTAHQQRQADEGDDQNSEVRIQTEKPSNCCESWSDTF